MVMVSQWQIVLLHKSLAADMTMQSNTAVGDVAVNDTAAAALPGGMQALLQKLIATGIPPVYGAQLQVSFDNAAAAIPRLSRFEQDVRPDKLTGETLRRYVAIGQSIACEFCCGVTTMVFADGRKACACAHSAAMRGVAAYLLDNYGDTMSDTQILAEVSKWKSVFFPGPTVNKYLAQSGLVSPNIGGQGAPVGGLQKQVGGC